MTELLVMPLQNRCRRATCTITKCETVPILKLNILCCMKNFESGLEISKYLETLTKMQTLHARCQHVTNV